VKITDFGLTRLQKSVASLRKRKRNKKLMPPELLPGAPPGSTWTTAADVYSFGLLVQKILGTSIIPKELGGNNLQQLLNLCLAEDPALRPSFYEIRQRLATHPEEWGLEQYGSLLFFFVLGGERQ